MSSVESQNYNRPIERIWDDRLKGFRPMTENERRIAVIDRMYKNKKWVGNMQPLTPSVQ